MDNKPEINNGFEDALQDILEPTDTLASSDDSIKGSNPIDDNSHIIQLKKSYSPYPNIIPAWLEKVVRVVAGIVAFVLLIIFALQIASR